MELKGLKKILASVVLVGAAVVGTTGCSSPYDAEINRLNQRTGAHGMEYLQMKEDYEREVKEIGPYRASENREYRWKKLQQEMDKDKRDRERLKDLMNSRQ